MAERLYLAGPCTGLPNFNYPAFAAAEAQLRAAGYDVASPHRVHDGHPQSRPGDYPWQWYMRQGIRQMLDCDAVALLPGWTQSRGARVESRLAHDLGMRVMELDAWLPQRTVANG